MRATTNLCLGAILTIGAALACAPVARADEACLYASRAYSVGFEGCFRRVQLSCDAHDRWVVRGSCAGTGVPSGGAAVPGLPDSFQGELCISGDWYSPEAEGCFGSKYQKCLTSSQWAEVTPVTGHPGCG
jgi:hypothetical protein